MTIRQAQGNLEKIKIVRVVCEIDFTQQYDYCHSSIIARHRWVREKIYDPAVNGRDPS
jgi:hypothetical protein